MLSLLDDHKAFFQRVWTLWNTVHLMDISVQERLNSHASQTGKVTASIFVIRKANEKGTTTTAFLPTSFNKVSHSSREQSVSILCHIDTLYMYLEVW